MATTANVMSPNGATGNSALQAFSLLRSALGAHGTLAMAGATAAIMLSAVFVNAPAFLIGWWFDARSLPHQSAFHNIVLLLGLLTGAIIAREGLDIVRKRLVEFWAVRLQSQEFITFVRRLLEARVDAMSQRHAAEIATLAERGVTGVIRLQKLVFLEFGPQLANALIAIGAAVWAHWVLGVAMLGVFAANAAVTTRQIHTQKGVRISLERQRRIRNGVVGELLGHLDSVRASGSSASELASLRAHAHELSVTEMNHHIAMMRYDAFENGVEAVGLVLVVGSSFYLLQQGILSAGTILVLVMLYQRAMIPLQMLHRILDESHEASIAIGEAQSVRNLPKDTGLFGREPIHASALVGAIVAIKNLTVDLSRPDGSSLRVLKNCSITIPPGQRVGVNGETGGGKSMPLKVMLGLVPDYQGSVRLFGTEVRSADKEQLYRQISYVAQNPFLKAGTLRENLCLGAHRDIANEELLEALRLAALPLEGERWFDGLTTRIPEHGAGLSGGERQRIALARVFLSRSPLIVLDEATSALDEPTESIVMENLCRYACEQTLLMIAHRPSALRCVNRLITIEHGRIAGDTPAASPPQPATAGPLYNGKAPQSYHHAS